MGNSRADVIGYGCPIYRETGAHLKPIHFGIIMHGHAAVLTKRSSNTPTSRCKVARLKCWPPFSICLDGAVLLSPSICSPSRFSGGCSPAAQDLAVPIDRVSPPTTPPPLLHPLPYDYFFFYFILFKFFNGRCLYRNGERDVLF